jgi:hypothetical protein
MRRRSLLVSTLFLDPVLSPSPGPAQANAPHPSLASCYDRHAALVHGTVFGFAFDGLRPDPGSPAAQLAHDAPLARENVAPAAGPAAVATVTRNWSEASRAIRAPSALRSSAPWIMPAKARLTGPDVRLAANIW